MPVLSESDTLVQQAKALVQKKDFKGALALYTLAVQKNDRSIPAHEGLASVAFLTQDYAAAVQHFQKVSLLDPRRSQALVNLGAVYNRQKDFNSAIKTLRLAVSRDRKCAEAYYNLGIAHKGLKQLSMAVNAYKEAIRLAPNLAEAYQNLANIYLEMGNNQQAILSFKRALEIRPDFERAKLGLEKAYGAKLDAKNSVSPFGRLVNVNEITDRDNQQYRELNSQERFDDRNEVHRLAKEAEVSAAGVLEQLRETFQNTLLKLAHAFQNEDSHQTVREFANFQNAKANFELLLGTLQEKTDELRQHEQIMKIS